MANIKSQIKRNKTNEKARQRNVAVKSALKTAVRRFREAAAAGDTEAATTALPPEDGGSSRVRCVDRTDPAPVRRVAQWPARTRAPRPVVVRMSTMRRMARSSA